MTEPGPRTGAARDVPPPRPVPPSAPDVDETGLGRAARAVADAVAGLVGGRSGDASAPADGRPRSTAGGLRDVLGAVAGAVASAFGPSPEEKPPAPSGVGSERSTGAVLGDLLAAAAPRLPI